MNAIIGLPSLTDWKMILDFNDSKTYYKAMHISFPLLITEASTCLYNSINFVPADFVRTKQYTSLAKAFIITQELTVLGITDIFHHDIV